MMKKQLLPVVVSVLMLGGNSAMAENTKGAMEHEFMPAAVADTLAVQVADPVQLNGSRAGIAPLAVALGIASFDVTLAGFFWGVYVPFYAPTEPAYDIW